MEPTAVAAPAGHLVGSRSMLVEVGVARGMRSRGGCRGHVHVENPAAHQVALFVHLVSLAAGFGGVATVDVHGLLWLLGRRSAGELAAVVTATHGLIAAGGGGLLASGAILHPDLGSTSGRLKLTLVLVIVLNGVNARRFATRLRAMPASITGDAIPWEYLPRAFATAAVSQAAWWGALVIGFLTTASRH